MAWKLGYAAPPQTLAEARERLRFWIQIRFFWTAATQILGSLEGRLFAGDRRTFPVQREVLVFLRAFADVLRLAPPLGPRGEERDVWSAAWRGASGEVAVEPEKLWRRPEGGTARKGQNNPKQRVQGKGTHGKKPRMRFEGEEALEEQR